VKFTVHSSIKREKSPMNSSSTPQALVDTTSGHQVTQRQVTKPQVIRPKGPNLRVSQHQGGSKHFNRHSQPSCLHSIPTSMHSCSYRPVKPCFEMPSRSTAADDHLTPTSSPTSSLPASPSAAGAETLFLTKPCPTLLPVATLQTQSGCCSDPHPYQHPQQD
jgi:hypothetical protein